MKIDPVALRTFLDAMHGHADIRDQRTKSIAGIVTDARAKGIDGKTIRKIFVRERMDAEKRQRDDDLLKAYEDALGGKGRALRAIEGGSPIGEACEANGVHRSTVARARAVAKQASNATPHDPETGEITNAASPLGQSDIGTVPQLAHAPQGEEGASTNSEDDGMTIPAYLRRVPA